MQKDKYNRNGRHLNHVLKYEEIFSEWTPREDFYISYFFSCHAQLCVHGDELRIVLLPYTPISSCPHHSTSQCNSFLFFRCGISICSLPQSIPPVHGLHKQAATRDSKPAPESGGAEVKMAFLSSQKAKVYLPHTELSTHDQQRQIST